MTLFAKNFTDIEVVEFDSILVKQYVDGIRQNGIDRLMDENNLDLLILPTGSPAWKTDLILGDNYIGGNSSYAAMAGYPSITVPMGNIDGLPVGISFIGRPWSEPILIEAAYSYEQETMHRIKPTFKR